jgi:L-fuconolactonase
MARLAKLPVMRGIRRLIQNQSDPDFAVRPDFIAAVKLLPKYNLSFDICIYHPQFPAVLKLVRQCPEVSFILDHIGKPGIKDGLTEPWKTHIRELGQLPNVKCKLSGVTTEADHAHWTRDQLRPYIDHAISSFGFDRIMYGGDWPVSELAGKYTDWLEVLDWATEGCSAEEKRKLFRDNGLKTYRLNA